MRYSFSISVVVMNLAAGFLSPVLATEPSIKPTSPSADRLVELLADPRYETRESAAQQLLQLGEEVLPAVRSAASACDPEIRCRALRLLFELEQQCFEQKLQRFVADLSGRRGTELPGWGEFQTCMGGEDASRRLYAEIYRWEVRLLNAVFSHRESVSHACNGERRRITELFESRIVELQNGSIGKQVSDAQPASQELPLLALLTIASTWPECVSDRSSQLLTQLARTEAAPLASGNGEQSRATRHLLTRWIVSSTTDDLYVLSQMLKLASKLELKGTASVAIDVATGKRLVRPAHSQFRASALLIAGKLGEQSHIPRLLPLMEDRAVCASQSGRSQPERQLLDVEVRDVALAVILHLQGAQPTDYGFEHIVEHGDKLFVLHSLAFSSASAREGAFDDWRKRTDRMRVADSSGSLLR